MYIDIQFCGSMTYRGPTSSRPLRRPRHPACGWGHTAPHTSPKEIRLDPWLSYGCTNYPWLTRGVHDWTQFLLRFTPSRASSGIDQWRRNVPLRVPLGVLVGRTNDAPMSRRSMYLACGVFPPYQGSVGTGCFILSYIMLHLLSLLSYPHSYGPLVVSP